MDLHFENLLFDCSLERPERNIGSSEKTSFSGMEQVEKMLRKIYGDNGVERKDSTFTITDDTGVKHEIAIRYRDSKNPSFTKADKNAEVAIGIYKDKSDDRKYVIIEVLNPESGGKYAVNRDKAAEIRENLSESNAVQKIINIMKAQVEG